MHVTTRMSYWLGELDLSPAEWLNFTPQAQHALLNCITGRNLYSELLLMNAYCNYVLTSPPPTRPE